MLALIFGLMTFCPLIHGNIVALQPYHTDDFSFVGSVKYSVRIYNPSPFAFSAHRVELVVKDEHTDTFSGRYEEFPRVTVPGETRDGNGVDVTFRDDTLDFRLLAGALVVCDGIAP